MQINATDLAEYTEPEGSIHVDKFEGCCGVCEIYRLEDFETDKEADALIKAAIEEAGNVAMVVYTTNQHQSDIVAALERAGFGAVSKGKNADSIITLWVKVITKVRTR